MSAFFSFHSRGIIEVIAQGHESYIYERQTFSVFFSTIEEAAIPKAPVACSGNTRRRGDQIV